MCSRPVRWSVALALGALAIADLGGTREARGEPAELWSTLPGKRRKRDTPLADLADRARPAVVHVRGVAPPEDEASGSPARTDGSVERVSIGTGFIINKKGYVVTNDHVVHGVTRLRVRLHDGREFAACVLGTDAPTDIALLKVDAHEDLPVLPLGDSEEVRVGEPVIAIGNPFGFNNSVTAGIVSAKERVVDRAAANSSNHPTGGTESYSFFIQTDASINLGNSGGPIIDRDGQVIGVSAAFWAGHPMQPAQGIGFAIPINMAKALLPRLRDLGSAPRSHLGVDAQPLEPSLVAALNLPSARGALLASVEKDSPAEAAGLEPGDVVVSWGQIPIATSEDLKIHAQLTVPGARVRVGLLRDGRRVEREVTLRAAAARAAPALHPSSCTLATAHGARERPEDLELTNVPAERAARLPGGAGVAVASVPSASAAAEAGLHVGDIILRIGKSSVRSATDVAAAVRAQKGEVIPLLVRRSGYDFWVALRRR
ncbi:MAG TPA: trypsin-like peptidase domain-containing protein [Polyangia bacterium]